MDWNDEHNNNYNLHKYHKTHKTKHIGGTKIFDIDEEYDFIGVNLQENLNELEKHFGNCFSIKQKDIVLRFDLKKINHEPYRNIKFWRLEHIEEKRTTSREPLVIDFVNPVNWDLNDICCMTSLQKTSEYTGKQLVSLCINICKKLNAKKIITGDEASIKCGLNGTTRIDISLLKLILSKQTYYTSMGWKFFQSNSCFFLTQIQDLNKIEEIINDIVDRIRLIKTNAIIKECEDTICLIEKAQKENYSEELEIIIPYPKIYHSIPSYSPNPIAQSQKILNLVSGVLKILHSNNDCVYIYELMAKLSKTSCDDYGILMDHLVLHP